MCELDTLDDKFIGVRNAIALKTASVQALTFAAQQMLAALKERETLLLDRIMSHQASCHLCSMMRRNLERSYNSPHQFLSR